MKRDFFWNTFGTIVWASQSFFLLIVVSKINGISDSGIFSFAYASAMIMYSVAIYGGRTYQVSDLKQEFKNEQYLTLRIFSGIIIVLLSICFSLLHGYNILKSLIILLLVLQRSIDAISDALYGVMQQKNKLFLAGRSLCLRGCGGFLLFFVVDLFTDNLLLSTLTLPLSSMAILFCYDLPKTWHLEKLHLKLNLIKILDILRTLFPTFALSVLNMLFINLGRYFIDIYYPDLQGIYGILMLPVSILSILIAFIYGPLILPFSELHH